MKAGNKILLIACMVGLTAGSLSYAQPSLKQPNVSANALFLYRNSNFNGEHNSTTRNGVDIQEAEIAFYSDVDPYSRLNVLVSVHPEYELNAAKTEVEKQNWIFEPEELYAESNHVSKVTLKLGKFKGAMGRHNSLHTHAFPFVEAPLMNTTLLGEEGLNDPGISAAYLLPTPWYSELIGQYLRGEGENSGFNSPTPGDGIGLVRWRHLWDLSDDTTFELGMSGARGANSLRGTTTLGGADVTLKWRPSVGGKYQSFILAGEFLDRRREQADDVAAELGTGWNAWVQYQLAQRWLTSFRYDHLRMINSADTTAIVNGQKDKYTGGLTFAATEFSSMRLEYSWGRGEANAKGEKTEQTVLVQANFTIGAHPSHTY
ncbi:MAG: hypothetical protein AB7F86_08280 [Bdellovibrionales bacterium]